MIRLLAIIGLITLLGNCAQKPLQDDLIYINDSEAQDFSVYLQEKLIGKEGKSIKIVFEKGTYHFYPDKATERYMKITNNDNGDKLIAFPLFDYTAVEIEGNGSDFIFHGGILPFVLSGLSKAQLRNFNVLWDKPFTFEGEVVANDSINNTFTLKVSEENEYEIVENELYFMGYDWKLKLGENIVYDKETKRPNYFTSKYEHNWHGFPLKAKELSVGVVQFSNFSGDKIPPLGSIWVDKGPHGENRRYPGFSIQDSKNIRLENINVYSSGAMALIAEKSKDITLKNFNVRLPEGSSRMIGASADATHFVGCKGIITMDSCLFENMLDDATNVHGTYMLVDQVIDSSTIRVSFGHYQQEGFEFASTGDTLRFISRSDLMPIKDVIVKSIHMDNENDYKIRFYENITGLSLENTVVENISYAAAVKITNCIVRQNRARSFLISTSKAVEISNNYFSSMMAGIRICGDANYWFESGPVSEVIVQNNTFEDLGIGGHNPQAILQIDPIIGKEFRSNGYYHRNIVFRNNTIKTFDRLLIYALSVDGLSITNNKIIKSDSYEEIYPNLSHFDLQNCRNVAIYGNTYNGDGVAEISLKNCVQVEIKDQIGFSETIMSNPNKYFYQN